MSTLAYRHIQGVQGHTAGGKTLPGLGRGPHAKVNLVHYLTVEGLPGKRPDETRWQHVAEALTRSGVTCTLRLEKGHDIDAACGQLRLKTERELAAGPANPSPANPGSGMDQPAGES